MLRRPSPTFASLRRPSPALRPIRGLPLEPPLLRNKRESRVESRGSRAEVFDSTSSTILRSARIESSGSVLLLLLLEVCSHTLDAFGVGGFPRRLTIRVTYDWGIFNFVIQLDLRFGILTIQINSSSCYEVSYDSVSGGGSGVELSRGRFLIYLTPKGDPPTWSK